MSKLTVTQLAEWGKGRDFGGEPLRLNPAGVITDRTTFFNSHLSVLEAGRERNNKRILMPYYHRLLRFYQLVTNEDKDRGVQR